jgi:hypothetical protein
LSSPPKPALAATLPSREVQRWWQPRGWAPLRVWASGKEGSVVEWMRMLEAPLAERRDFGVAAMAKMSAGWAAVGGDGLGTSQDEVLREVRGGDVSIVPPSTVWAVRYCFDWKEGGGMVSRSLGRGEGHRSGLRRALDSTYHESSCACDIAASCFYGKCG